MKRIIIFWSILFSLSSCSSQKEQEEIKKQKPVQAIIGNIKIHKNKDFNMYSIYVPLKIVNYTQDTIFLRGREDYGSRLQLPFDSISYFIGLLDNDTIDFKSYDSFYTLFPLDSVKISLINSSWYRTSLPDSIFIEKIKSIRIEYTGQDVISDTTIKILPEMTAHTRLIIFKENVGFEDAFEFGNLDFE